MKYLLQILTTILLLHALSACVAVQEIGNVVEVSQQHERIAVVPIQAALERKLWMSTDKYNELCQLKSEETQQRIYRFLEFYSRSGALHAELMTPDEVNSILHGANYPNTNLSNVELCSLLHVDAIIFGNIQVWEPVDEVTALMLNSATQNGQIITNIVQLSLSLYDAKRGEQIWNGQETMHGQLGSFKDNMQRQICRRAVRNLPYNIKKRRYKKAYQTLNGF